MSFTTFPIATTLFIPPNHYNVKDPQFAGGAKGDTRQIFTAAVNAGASTITCPDGFPGIAVGMYFRLRFGGTSSQSLIGKISVINSSTSVSFTSTSGGALTAGTNVSTGYMIYGTGDLAAIRACWAACCAQNRVMFVPYGEYLLEGTLLTDDGTGADPNCLIPIYPNMASGTVTKRFQHVIIMGEGKPFCINGGPEADYVRPMTCTTFTALRGGTNGTSSIFGASTNAVLMQITIMNIAAFVDPNPSGTGPTMSVFRFENTASAELIDCVAGIDSSLFYSVEPGFGTGDASIPYQIVGFSTSKINMQAESRLVSCRAWGLGVGIIAKEHMITEGQCAAYGCYAGLCMGEGNQTSFLGRINLHWNKRHFSIRDSGAPLVIQMLNFEERDDSGYNGHKWFSTDYHFYNSTGWLAGTVEKAYISSSPFGSTFQINGGLGNLSVYNIYNQLINGSTGLPYAIPGSPVAYRPPSL